MPHSSASCTRINVGMFFFWPTRKGQETVAGEGGRGYYPMIGFVFDILVFLDVGRRIHVTGALLL